VDEPPADDLPEQLRVRREKLARLRAAGREPYPVGYPRTATLAEVRGRFGDLPADSATGEVVAVTGRVIFVRNTGKLCFATLRDGDGTELQAMLSADRVGRPALDEWKQLVDIGDLIGVRGEVITSRRGELSVLADEWTMTGKALRPLPVEHRPMTDETRVRQRYVDLIVRPPAGPPGSGRWWYGACVTRCTSGTTWRWRPRRCSCCMAAPPPARSSPTAMRST
jgi:lysyl-tRNA synthetase class 2